MRNFVIVLISVLFVICNWLMDASFFLVDEGNCLVNGFWSVCDTNALGHLVWYVSMLLFVVMTFLALHGRGSLDGAEKRG